VEEIQVRLKNVPRNITVVNPNGVQQSIYPNNSHFLLRVKSTESKKTWAIDITGAQFGLTQQLWSWDEYSNECIEKVEEVSELKTSWELFKTFSLVQGAPSVDYGIPFAAMDCVNIAIQAWEKTELDRRIFVLLNDENFPAAQAGLLEIINQTACKFVAESDFSKELQKTFEYEQKNPNASRENLLHLHSMLSSSIHPQNRNCSNCDKPAFRRCRGCRVHVYCNAKCQTAHWIDHKNICKTKNLEKIMHRAAALLQKMYLAFRRTTFRAQYTKIEDSGRHLTMHLNNSTPETRMFIPFPDHMIPSEKDRQMVLCASRCVNFVRYFQKIIEAVLQGKS
jgi:hypothetical protein